MFNTLRVGYSFPSLPDVCIKHLLAAIGKVVRLEMLEMELFLISPSLNQAEVY